MNVLSDIEIAQSCTMKPITEIAETAGVDAKYLELYGNYKAKVDYRLLRENTRPDGKLVLVTAINPTPAGEGKTTTTVGLADAMRKLGKNTLVALREPSLGPVFGVKGGAAGGGYAQVVPMEDINLHFTGDFHAIGAANNLCAAMLDNHIQQGNALGIDVKRITWKRCVDMNDRQLRNIVDGLGGRMQGVPREDGFDITVASEIMAVLCLSADIPDLKARLGRMVVAYTYAGKPVTAHDLKAEGAVAALQAGNDVGGVQSLGVGLAGDVDDGVGVEFGNIEEHAVGGDGECFTPRGIFHERTHLELGVLPPEEVAAALFGHQQGHIVAAVGEEVEARAILREGAVALLRA